jgi:hypothetical protein
VHAIGERESERVRERESERARESSRKILRESPRKSSKKEFKRDPTSSRIQKGSTKSSRETYLARGTGQENDS